MPAADTLRDASISRFYTVLVRRTDHTHRIHFDRFPQRRSVDAAGELSMVLLLQTDQAENCQFPHPCILGEQASASLNPDVRDLMELAFALDS